MTPLEELTSLLGVPTFANDDPAAWNALEEYLGSELPADYKAFLDAYGSGMICNTLLVSHPACEVDAVARQKRFQEMFVTSYAEAMEVGAGDGEYPYPFHQAPGGLFHIGSGGVGGDVNHFFLPGGPDPSRWKIVSLPRDEPYLLHDGPFAAFVLDFVNRWCTPPSEDEWADMQPAHQAWREQEAARGTFTPGFTPIW